MLRYLSTSVIIVLSISVLSAAVMFSCGGCAAAATSIANVLESECQTDAQCDDGVFCNGAEKCQSLNCGPFPGCLFIEPKKECRPGRPESLCCTSGVPDTSACVSACNEDKTCERGEECITDADCAEGFDTCTGRHYCDNGFCYTDREPRLEILSEVADLSQCRDACDAEDVSHVSSFATNINSSSGEIFRRCNCITDEVLACNSSRDEYYIDDDENGGCEAVCELAGWPETRGPVGDPTGIASPACICGLTQESGAQ